MFTKKRYTSDKLDQLESLNLYMNKFEILNKLSLLEINKYKKTIINEIESNYSVLDNFIEKDIYTNIGNIIFDVLTKKM